MNVVKEERVTEAFLGLDEEVRGCQNHEAQEDCQTRYFIKTALEECECLPFNIRTDEWKKKVDIMSNIQINAKSECCFSEGI